jgi:putative transposase
MEYISQGVAASVALRHCRLPRSTFYYVPKGGLRGRQPYGCMLDDTGVAIESHQVLKQIQALFAKDFIDYGCYKTYIYLRDSKRYKVSKHRVYLLMKEHGLLRNRHLPSSKKGRKNWVKDLLPKTSGPFSYFEFDIKYMWVAGKRRNAQMLSVIDVENRMVLGQYIAYNIDRQHVVKLFEQAINTYSLPTNFTVRSDNGSQFVAKITQDYLKSKGITQEFTKPATPEQDAHIEAFHSIVERAICQRFVFDSLKDLKDTLQKFMEFYNFERIHSGTKYTSPYLFLLQKEKEKPSPHLKSTMERLSLDYENYLSKLSNI